MGNVICSKCGSDQTTLLFVGYVCDICEPPKNVGAEPEGCHPWPGYRYAVATDGDYWTKDKLLNHVIINWDAADEFTWDTQSFMVATRMVYVSRIICVSPDKKATTIFYGTSEELIKWLENPI